LYEADLKDFAADGTLSRLEVAFSRVDASQKKVYVQHLMAQHARELHDMLVTKKGYVFVCGDGASMSKDVYETLVNIIGPSEVEGKEALALMAKEGRFVRDIWS
jgi:NADPH-ferrihemoprotein reductase